MCRCARLTYVEVYDRYMGVSSRQIDAQVRRDVCALRRCCLRRRLAALTHLERAITTQQRFAHVEAATLEEVRRALRLVKLGTRLRLRGLQAHILQHLWRPGARLACRERHRVQQLPLVS